MWSCIPTTTPTITTCGHTMRPSGRSLGNTGMGNIHTSFRLYKMEIIPGVMPRNERKLEMKEIDESLIDWIRLTSVPKIVEQETGYKYTIATVYNWARRGWLRTNGYKPLRTTRRWVLDFLAEHKRRGGG